MAKCKSNDWASYRRWFFYDFDKEEPFSENDIEKIEILMRAIIEKKDPVKKEVWDRESA